LPLEVRISNVTEPPSVVVNVPETELPLGGSKYATPLKFRVAVSCSVKEVLTGTVYRASSIARKTPTTVITTFRFRWSGLDAAGSGPGSGGSGKTGAKGPGDTGIATSGDADLTI
jgi:hypothetical protein